MVPARYAPADSLGQTDRADADQSVGYLNNPMRVSTHPGNLLEAHIYRDGGPHQCDHRQNGPKAGK